MRTAPGYISALKFGAAFALLGALLAGCGGGSDGNTSMAAPDRLAGQGIVVGEPNPGPPIPAEFIAAAQQASCAEVRNRLYVIDQKYVFAERAGNCADASYSNVLYGASVQAQLCVQADSIAGPVSTCTDPAAKALFDVIVTHRGAADLGLGAGHTVTPIAFSSKDPGSLLVAVK